MRLDAARQFLSASSQGEKYDLFMRGTQLQQLSEEYQTCLQNISQTNNIIGQKKEALPDLEQAFNSAKADFEEATKARRLKEEIEELKKEMAWSHVQDKEDVRRLLLHNHSIAYCYLLPGTDSKDS